MARLTKDSDYSAGDNLGICQAHGPALEIIIHTMCSGQVAFLQVTLTILPIYENKVEQLLYNEKIPLSFYPFIWCLIRVESIKTVLNKFISNHMHAVRHKLRVFRQDFEEEMQNLRDSGTALAGTFRLFTEGGNYAMAEIATYQAQLDRISGLITNCEVDELGKLEQAERRRQEVAEAQLALFEDKARVHLADLSYAERVLRAVTNAQVRIKIQVCDSNSQARRFDDGLMKFELLIDQLVQHLRITSSAEKIGETADESPSHQVQLNEFTALVMAALAQLCTEAADRCIFLNCLRSQTRADLDESVFADCSTLPETPAVNEGIFSGSSPIVGPTTLRNAMPKEQTSQQKSGKSADQQDRSRGQLVTEKSILRNTCSEKKGSNDIAEVGPGGTKNLLSKIQVRHYTLSRLILLFVLAYNLICSSYLFFTFQG
ncbi:unnamed protein product [Protopolystoma xenopodis]|uniref:Uncharacterized protein n=1 Tax=Protopolystoma xenopodis TaxID=117903 RepID=A0A448XBU4_9PLAT|nr:unnamed protein product [Protopolystoma xenopodis]